MKATRTYDLPPTFYWDHVARDLPAGTVVAKLARSVRVTLDADEYAELLSDARHYAYSMAEGGFDGFGLMASARATVRRLEATPFA